MAMEEGCRRQRARGLSVVLGILVILLHLGLLGVAAEGDLRDACPILPTSSRDLNWADGLGQPAANAMQLKLMRKLRILSGTFTQGAKPLFSKSPDLEAAKTPLLQGVRLVVLKAAPSAYRDVYSVTVTLTLGFWQKYAVIPVGMRGQRGRPLGRANTDTDLVIAGEGLYSTATGDLCMVGCIGSDCKYKLSLKYPSSTTIQQISVVGNVSSVLESADMNRFDPVIIASVSEGAYAYTKNDTLTTSCPALTADASSGKLWTGENFLQQGWVTQSFQITWHPDCQTANCSPFAGVGRKPSDQGSFLKFDRVRGDGNRMHGLAIITNGNALPDRFADPTSSDGMLVVEGVWNSTTGGEDCQIALTMEFPLTFTASQREVAIGHVTSLRKESESTYFKSFTFRQSTTGLHVSKFTGLTNQPEYVYSKVEKAKKLCFPGARKPAVGKYPSGAEWGDLEFHALKDSRNQVNNFINLNLFTVGKQFRTFGLLHAAALTANTTGLGEAGMINVSYSVFYQFKNTSVWDANIPSEGLYDAETGRVCLIGCQVVDLKKKGLTDLEGESQRDCQLFFSIQLPPKDSGSERLKGSLRSLRSSTDPLYFKPETFSGIVREQAIESILRVDLEIVMSVVMLSLTVLFILLQLVYSKRYPDTLPYISTSMLLLLSLAHMIPLVLNFEALFQKRTGYRALSGGWPEVNEVVVRLTTMTAMLLQLRLLQLVWKSRNEARVSGMLGPAVQERRVLYTILPIYAVGGVIAVLIHSLFGFKPLEHDFLWRESQGGLWWDIKAYGGLLLDFHLFPQVVGNILWGAKEQAPLSKPFYFGMALVRSLPHIYDLCRKFKFIPSFSDTYLYANPEWDFYSVTSDVSIPCGIILLAILVYMQQRWGGRCLLPQRWRSSLDYTKVSSIGP